MYDWCSTKDKPANFRRIEMAWGQLRKMAEQPRVMEWEFSYISAKWEVLLRLSCPHVRKKATHSLCKVRDGTTCLNPPPLLLIARQGEWGKVKSRLVAAEMHSGVLFLATSPNLFCLQNMGQPVWWPQLADDNRALSNSRFLYWQSSNKIHQQVWINYAWPHSNL